MYLIYGYEQVVVVYMLRALAGSDVMLASLRLGQLAAPLGWLAIGGSITSISAGIWYAASAIGLFRCTCDVSPTGYVPTASSIWEMAGHGL